MSVIKQLFQKWLGLSDEPCGMCEILRSQLDRVDNERRELLHKLLDKDKIEPPFSSQEDVKPVSVGQKFIPWNVRREMLEAEDRKTAQLMRDKQKEIDSLEKELGVSGALK